MANTGIAKAAIEAEPVEDDDVPLEDQVKALFMDAEDQVRRLQTLARGDVSPSSVLHELIEAIGTLKDTIALVGDTLIVQDDRLADLEDEAEGVQDSQLIESDAKKYLEVLQKNVQFYTEMKEQPGLPEGQTVILDELIAANRACAEFTKELTIPDPEEGEDEKEEGDEEEDEDDEDEDGKD